MTLSQSSFADEPDTEFDLLCKALPHTSDVIKNILSTPLYAAWSASDHAILMGWINAVTKDSFHDALLTRQIQIAYQKGQCTESSDPSPSAE
jgi:hypothetical protein